MMNNIHWICNANYASPIYRYLFQYKTFSFKKTLHCSFCTTGWFNFSFAVQWISTIQHDLLSVNRHFEKVEGVPTDKGFPSLVPRLTQIEVGESDLGFPLLCSRTALSISLEVFPLLCLGTAFPFCTRGKEILSKVKSSVTPSAAKTWMNFTDRTNDKIHIAVFRKGILVTSR